MKNNLREGVEFKTSRNVQIMGELHIYHEITVASFLIYSHFSPASSAVSLYKTMHTERNRTSQWTGLYPRHTITDQHNLLCAGILPFHYHLLSV